MIYVSTFVALKMNALNNAIVKSGKRLALLVH